MNSVDEKAEYLGSRTIQGRTYNYFRGSDLYVYQFHGDVKAGYLCHLSAWEVFAKNMDTTPELSPTTKDISTIKEYGLTQKLSNSIRCF